VPRVPDTFSSEALLDYCQDVMPRYMIPRQIEVHASLQRTSSGKVDRAAVRA
jgi:acyl-CoA synthetase (AMP-forming)/AMP-acid ligase II